MPKKPQRTPAILLRLAVGERESIQERARACGVTTTQWILDVVRRERALQVTKWDASAPKSAA
jgi:hypothetical protein